MQIGRAGRQECATRGSDERCPDAQHHADSACGGGPAEFEVHQVHAGGALVDQAKLDSLQAMLLRSQLALQRPPADLLSGIIDDVLAALGAGQAAEIDGSVMGTAGPGSSEAGAGAGTRKEAVVSWDRVRDLAYLARVIKVCHLVTIWFGLSRPWLARRGDGAGKP